MPGYLIADIYSPRRVSISSGPRLGQCDARYRCLLRANLRSRLRTVQCDHRRWSGLVVTDMYVRADQHWTERSWVGGFVRSYAPRFTAATRIALFFPIFLLTGNTGVVSVSPNMCRP